VAVVAAVEPSLPPEDPYGELVPRRLLPLQPVEDPREEWPQLPMLLLQQQFDADRHAQEQ
jgi:hypothetical protein